MRALGQTREDELREFYVEHGQMAYRFRARPRAARDAATSLDPVRNVSTALQRIVLARDRYCCRYCGTPVVPKAVLDAYALVVGTGAFPTKAGNAGKHGVVLAFRANIDHVLPHNLGGRTDATNLVAACWSCNYGKNRFTVEELSIEDPRGREPLGWNDWTGLTEYLAALRSFAGDQTRAN